MITVTKPYLPDVGRYQSYVERIFKSGHLTNNGPVLREFEERLCDYLGVESLLLVANGTIALQVAYKALGLKGVVGTTPFSFPATVSSLVWEHCRPEFIDINPKTFNVDLDSLPSSAMESLDGLVAVHVFSNPCDVDAIEQYGNEYGFKVVYDAAHCFGVNYRGGSLLNYGDASTVSFHATKVFHTIEGGCIVFKEKETLERARDLIRFGYRGEDNVVDIGINGKMNEFQAAMGLCLLDEFDTIVSIRQSLYEQYVRRLNGALEFQDYSKDAENNFGYVPVLFEDEQAMLGVKNCLSKQNILPRRYFYPSLNTLNYVEYKHMAYSEDIASRILCLPIHCEMTIDDVDLISNTILGAI